MAPPATTSDPADPIVTPQPSATQDSGAKQTMAVWDPIPLPSLVQHVPLPKKTDAVPAPKIQPPKETNPVPITKPQVSQSHSTGDSGTKHNDGPQQGSGSTDPGGHSNIQSGNSAKIGNSEDPEVPGNSKQGALQDPSAPTQIQETVSTQFATDSAVQYDPQNEADPGESSNSQGTISSGKITTTLDGHALIIGPTGVVQVDGVNVNPSQILTGITGEAAVNKENSIVVASQIFYSATPIEQAATVIGGKTTVRESSIPSIGGLIMGGFGDGTPSINSSSLVGSAPTSIRNSTSSGLLTFEGKAESLGRRVLGKLAGLAIVIHLVLYLHIYS